MLGQCSHSVGVQPAHPLSIEELEKHIRTKLEWLYTTLQQADKYQKYREKQPSLTPAEVIARDAVDKKEREQREAAGITQNQKETTVWPDFLENAFWRALIRWPPMGRKKYMLAGVLKGRNELIQDSIYRDTGITRDRKQISSHIQVLKGHLKGFPVALAYMGTLEESTKLCCGPVSSLPRHSSHLRDHQHTQRIMSATKDSSIASPHIWPQHGSPHLGFAPSGNSCKESLASSLAAVNLTVLDEGDHQPMRYLPRMHQKDMFDNPNVTDIPSWCRQYPGFGFLQTQAECWKREGRIVLMCDAFVKTWTEAQPKANVSIALTLRSCLDFSKFASLKCTTNIYDGGRPTLNRNLDNIDPESGRHQTSCHYAPDPEGSTGYLRIEFGSHSLFNVLKRYGQLISTDESDTPPSPLGLTVVQDVYGCATATNGAQCLFTILWRFHQISQSAEGCSMKWRTICFGEHYEAEHPRHQQSRYQIGSPGHDRDEVMTEFSFTSGTLSPCRLISEFPTNFLNPLATCPSYEVLADHDTLPLPLSPEILSPTQPSLDQMSASALTSSSDYSQQSFALPIQDASSMAHDNNFAFSTNNISSTSPPDFDFTAYRDFSNYTINLENLHTLSGFDHREWTDLGLAVSDEVDFLPIAADADMHDPVYASCTSTKPSWQHTNLVANLENAAEQYQSYCSDESHMQISRCQAVLHDRDYYQQGSPHGELAERGFGDVQGDENYVMWGSGEMRSSLQR